MIYFGGYSYGGLNLVNMTISQNTSKGYLISCASYLEPGNTGINIKNSIIWDNYSDADITFRSLGANVSMDYCDIDTSVENWFYVNSLFY